VAKVRAEVLDHFGADQCAIDAASVTFLGVEPIEILRIPGEELVRYLTIGGSRHPMVIPVPRTPIRCAGREPNWC